MDQSNSLHEINVAEFSEDYCVYIRYFAPTHTRIDLNLREATAEHATSGNRIITSVRYQDEWDCTSGLVLNNRANDVWQTEIRPSGFPFSTTTGTETSMIVVPKASEYAIYFDFGNFMQSYSFPFRNGHLPTLVKTIDQATLGHSACGTSSASVFELAIGHTINSLDAGMSIHITASTTSVTNFVMIIDISHGVPQERDDVRVPLRILVNFGSEQTIKIQTVDTDQSIDTEQILNNTVLPGNDFSIQCYQCCKCWIYNNFE